MYNELSCANTNKGRPLFFSPILYFSRISRCWKRAGGGQSAPIPATGQRLIWRSSVLSSASQESSPFYLSLKALKNIFMKEIFEEEDKRKCRHQTYHHKPAVEKGWGRDTPIETSLWFLFICLTTTSLFSQPPLFVPWLFFPLTNWKK